MASKEYAIVFSLIGKMSNTFQKSFQAAGNVIKNCNNQMVALNRQAKDVEGMAKHRQTIDATAKAHRLAREEMLRVSHNPLVAGSSPAGLTTNPLKTLDFLSGVFLLDGSVWCKRGVVTDFPFNFLCVFPDVFRHDMCVPPCHDAGFPCSHNLQFMQTDSAG